MTGRESETREGGLGTRERGAGERKREGRLHFRSISFAVVAPSLSLSFFSSLFLSSPLLFFSFLSTFQNDTRYAASSDKFHPSRSFDTSVAFPSVLFFRFSNREIDSNAPRLFARGVT